MLNPKILAISTSSGVHLRFRQRHNNGAMSEGDDNDAASRTSRESLGEHPDDAAEGGSRPGSPAPLQPCALYNAARQGRCAEVEACIDAGQDPEAQFTCRRWTALHAALAHGRTQVVHTLQARGADMNATTGCRYRSPPSHVAATANQPQSLRALHEAGSEMTAVDAVGSTATHAAAAVGSAACLRALKEMGIIDPYTKDDLGQTPLFLAASHQFEECVRFLYDFSHQMGVADKRGTTPLRAAIAGGGSSILSAFIDANELDVTEAAMAACEAGNTRALRYLSDQGVDIGGVVDMDTGTTATFTACVKGHASVVEVLHELGAVDVTSTDAHGRSPAMVAVVGGHIDVLRVLHKLGAALNTPDADGETPACVAVRCGSLAALDVLSECGVSLEARNAAGATAACVAAQCGSVDALRALSRLGADMCVVDTLSLSPMCHAALGGHIMALEYLLREHGHAVEATGSRWGPAIWAAAQGMVGPLRVLHAAGVSLDCEAADDGMTPLRAAIANHHVPIVRLLLSLGVSATHVGRGGCTPLHAAACEGHDDLVQLLAAAPGVDVNAADDAGRSPAHQAAARGWVRCVVCLYDAGADLAAADDEGWTIGHAAVFSNHASVVAAVASGCMAALNSGDTAGDTPLHVAIEVGHMACVQALLSAGVDVEARNTRGASPVVAAAMYGRTDALKLLKATGADLFATAPGGGASACFVAREYGHEDSATYLEGELAGVAKRVDS